jgi:hypothetical protein
VRNRTSAYEDVKGEWKKSVPNFDTHGATSLFTTPADLLKWQHDFETMTIGSAALFNDALTSAVLNNGKPTNYGFGISLGKYRGAETYGHGGADGGYRADLLRFPAQHLNLAVACNFAEATPNVYARAVADIILEGKLEPRAVASKPAAGNVSAERIGQLAGIYKAAAHDGVFSLAVNDGKLMVENFGVALEPIDANHFSVFGTPVEFMGPADAPPTAMKIGATGDSLLRVPPFKPTVADLAAYAGDYWSDELRVSYRVQVKDSVLEIHPYKRNPEKLKPAYQDAFSGGDAGTVRFVRTKGRVTGFRLTGGRVRNVEFVRAPNGP